METAALNKVLEAYGFNPGETLCVPFGSGLINYTWKITGPGGAFILQRINTEIFKSPDDIANNISLIGNYLKQQHPEYFFVRPLQYNTVEMLEIDGAYFRVFPFVKDSHTINVVSTAEQAYEAARQFASFTKTLSGFDPQLLYITIPDFHNPVLRYAQFEAILENGNKARIAASELLIQSIKKHQYIVEEFETIKKQPAFKLRVTHHDTKISNVLFNADNKGICVIDLDTVMPGYFISDVGDMMRTYLSPVSEEEKDFSKIEIRKDIYKAIINGYMGEMDDELSATEKKYFNYAGKFMIYMQATRFLTDHLNNDIYYGAKYEGHNFVRAGNQIALLERLIEFVRKFERSERQ